MTDHVPESDVAAPTDASPAATASSEAPAAAPAPIASLGPRAPLALPWNARFAYPAAALSGFVYYLGFPGVNLWPLAFVSQVPLILALRGQTPRRAAGLGLVAGFVISVCGFYWLFGMLKEFSGFPDALCALFTALLCAYQGGRTALLGWLYARAERRGWSVPVVFSLAFVASELLYPLLFPWYVGASFHRTPIFLQVADLGGPYLIGLVVVAANVALAELFLARLEKRPLHRAVVATGFAIPALAAAYGAVRLRQVDATAEASPAIKVGLVQGNQPLLDHHRAMPVHFRLTEQMREQGAELVVWSEGSVPGMFPETHVEDLVRDKITKRLGVPSIIGVALGRGGHGGSRNVYFNTALLADKDGTVLGRYDKHYLLAFGEYLPFGDVFPVLYKYSPNSGQFSKGDSAEPMVFGDHKISTFICYEDILPAFVNEVVRHADPDLLVNITNDAWFGDTTEPWEHVALAQLRAVEHRRFLVRVTNSGVSAIIDAAGRITQHGGTFKEEAFVGTARFMRAHTVYEMVGDVPYYVCALVVIAMGFRQRRARA